jgi:cyclopropane-fatty-acyl-phospholipid synthase
MKSTNLESSIAIGSTNPLAERWARKTVHALLQKITTGSLTLEEGGQVRHFGQDRKMAAMKATIQVKAPAAYLAVLRGGDIGAGEAYMLGLWDSPNLLEVIRIFVSNIALLENMQGSRWQQWALKGFQWLRRNNREGSRRNIAAHYDLSNDFFKLFLDETMAYSSGIFLHAGATLEQASVVKFARICEQLELKSSDHLLEIGTGWGGLAIHAAKNFGCRVTTTTLSQQQYDYASNWVVQEGLSHLITVLKQDYRDLQGAYEKLVSVEMIEAVGAEYYPVYFRKCSSLLKPQGLMLIQAITISDQRYQQSVGSADFIKRYIFPGGQLPCNSEIARQISMHSDMQLVDLKDITLDYALTLKAWRERFHDKLPEVRELGFDETFIRMWRYYLCFCEGGFIERVIHTAQYLLAKPQYRKLKPFPET